jgi:FAD/FMN-containing dehydrogenase
MQTSLARLAATRRKLLGALVATPGAIAAVHARAMAPSAAHRVRPGERGRPADSDWQTLKTLVGGRLERCVPPDLSQAEATADFANQFWLRDQPAYTQISGWAGAWRSEPSAYVVKPASAADVSAAVRFAAAHRLRLVVRGGGHSYLGGSCAPDSLLLWMRPMDQITVHDAFVPAGVAAAPVPAVSLGGGCIWLHAYQAVTGGAGRYVQGGGCTTVGVGGHVQGGGFGSFSKRYGTGAASLIEAEIVTADGAVRVVNAARDPDLFLAIKGGGGGTFGVVTRFTLRTHDLPATFGAARWTVQANSDDAFRRLLQRFVETYAANLFNEHWGEQVTARGDNQLHVEMVFQGLDAATAHAAWTPLTDFVRDHPSDYRTLSPLLTLPIPARMFWNADFLSRYAPGAITRDPRPDANPNDFWWAGDGGQAGSCWLGYGSAWLPQSLLKGDGPARLADAWFEASRHRWMAFHFNKGMAGGAPEAIAASRDTSMNPQVLDAFALAIVGGIGESAYAPFSGPDPEAARDAARSIQAADLALRKAAPDAGSYLSECDYFMPNWQVRAWGEHYPRLARIKRRYDPDGLFTVHHGVGSEGWSADGFTRT